MEKYQRQMLREFINATGEQDKSSFLTYLKEREELKDIYKEILEYYHIYPISETLEVGKNQMDSIFLPTKATIMTPYIDRKRKNLYNEEPTLERIENIKNIFDIVGYNPYDEESILLYKDIHDKTYKTVSFGLFGKAYDKDLKAKRKLFSDYLNSLDRGYEYEEIRVRDNIFYTSKSKNKFLEKVREK